MSRCYQANKDFVMHAQDLLLGSIGGSGVMQWRCHGGLGAHTLATLFARSQHRLRSRANIPWKNSHHEAPTGLFGGSGPVQSHRQ